MALAGSTRRIVAALTALMSMAAITRAEEVNDYPTSARAEYVYGCMKANNAPKLKGPVGGLQYLVIST